MPLTAPNPVSAATLADDDIFLNFVRDRVMDRLVYDSAFDAASATWVVSHLVTRGYVDHVRKAWRFPQPKQDQFLLDWLAAEADGVNQLVETLHAKLAQFSSPNNRKDG